MDIYTISPNDLELINNLVYTKLSQNTINSQFTGKYNTNIASDSLCHLVIKIINKISKNNFVPINNIVQYYKSCFPIYLNNHIKAYILFDNTMNNLIICKNNISYKGKGICIYLDLKKDDSLYHEIISKL